MRLMLIEDDSVDRYAILRLLRRTTKDPEVITAGDGLTALQILRAMTDRANLLVLLDLHMPVMGGADFLRQARKEDLLGSAIVIVMSGLDVADARAILDDADVRIMTKERFADRTDEAVSYLEAVWAKIPEAVA